VLGVRDVVPEAVFLTQMADRQTKTRSKYLVALTANQLNTLDQADL